MIRIIQLTDLHLNKQNLKDWKDYISIALTSKLNELNGEQNINLIAFTGDLIDRGGKDFGSAKNAFEIAESDVISTICQSIGIPRDRFLLVPGNHDITRTSDDQIDEYGCRKVFTDRTDLSAFMDNAIQNESYNRMLRIQEFKEFEKNSFNGSQIEYDWTVFGTSVKFNADNTSLGVCCFNNSWRCFDNEDKGRLILGEDQLVRATKFVDSCDVKIALAHHPFDWISDVERKIVSEHVHQDFDILLLGHTHETVTNVQTGTNGSIFINVAPSGLNDIRSDSRSFANGFTVIDIDLTKSNIICQYWRYNHIKRKYVRNTDEGNGDDGTSEFPILPRKSASKRKHHKSILDNIQNDHYPTMDNHLISAQAEINYLPIKQGFVFPPIVKAGTNQKEDEKELVTLSQIMNLKSNLIFFGDNEAGKTALLYRLVVEYIDQYEFKKKIPVFIDFAEFGNKEISTSIKEYLGISSKETQVLIDDEMIIILLDNIDYDPIYTNQINKLHRFFEENENIQLIATGYSDIPGIAPDSFLKNCEIPFRNYFLRNLRTKEIKNMIKLWIPNSNEDAIKTNERVEKLVANFEYHSLPSSALYVSLFMWSTEHSNREPINSAVLVEIYIEIILEKLKKDNIYRKSFDFKNKLLLIASIAQEMLVVNETNYSIKYKDFISIIEKYLEEKVGFDHDPLKLANYFLERRIFVKYKSNKIKFSNLCFFNFFLAVRMDNNKEFRDYVLQESEYYKFPNVIDFYTGLRRTDKELLELILERFESDFSLTDSILDQIDFDSFFTPHGPLNEPISNRVELNTIKENRPSEEMLERLNDRRLAQIKNPSNILEKRGEKTIDRMLIIMSNVLRGSEGVEDLDLKRKAYSAILKNALIYSVLHREVVIEYVLKTKKLPSHIPSDIGLRNYLANIPLFVQGAMQKHLGSPKLNSIVLEKIKTDRKSKSRSNIEEFFSVSLYTDNNGKDFEKVIMGFIKALKSGSDNYIAGDYLFRKLVDYFYRRTRTGSEKEQLYLNLLAELKIKNEKLPKRLKSRIIKSYEDAKQKYFKQSN